MAGYQLREQDRWLPIANVARLMKGTLPATAKVSKDAKECMQECVSEFISFITSEASDKCLMEKRKTINGEDILYSMNILGFENYSELLKIYLAKYRQQQALKQERAETRKKKPRRHETGETEGEDVKQETTDAESFFHYDKDQGSGDEGSKHTDAEHSTDHEVKEEEGIGYVDQLYEQSYGDGHYAHNPNYHNEDYGTGVDLTRVSLDPAQSGARASTTETNEGSTQTESHLPDAAEDGEQPALEESASDDKADQRKTMATSNEADLSLNLNDNLPTAVSETEELAGLTNGHHGESVLYRYQSEY